ncbi:hypothetical protein P9314_05950 [Paenibacillus validus]|uniref:hypothetical protein n=1 Tax=Paenibacillus TaxID=44249 RepID=UPI0006D11F4B|nr:MULTISPECIES: hypothetical protein [Paenibacillus]MED4600244.1 hypothetical protein [Paenibacillus validus]MED4605245.1 hypothetical protein [Paenibacillus validus]
MIQHRIPFQFLVQEGRLTGPLLEDKESFMRQWQARSVQVTITGHPESSLIVITDLADTIEAMLPADASYEWEFIASVLSKPHQFIAEITVYP